MATLSKFFIFRFVVIFCINTYSQDFNKIKQADTVYVLFYKELYKQIYLPQKMGYGNYYFSFDKFYEYRQINFYHSPKTPEERKEKKSFLRKHRDIIII